MDRAEHRPSHESDSDWLLVSVIRERSGPAASGCGRPVTTLSELPFAPTSPLRNRIFTLVALAAINYISVRDCSLRKYRSDFAFVMLIGLTERWTRSCSHEREDLPEGFVALVAVRSSWYFVEGGLEVLVCSRNSCTVALAH